MTKQTIFVHIMFIALVFLGITACKDNASGDTASASSTAATATATQETEEAEVIPEPEGEVIGEVSGVVDGETFSNYVLISDLAGFEEPLASASYTKNVVGYTVDILSYRYSQMSRNGGMNLHIKLDDDLNLIDEDSYGTYLESMMDVYNLSRGGSVENVTATLDGDGLLTISGNFAGKAEESVLWDDGEELDFVTLEDGKFSVRQIAEHVW